MEEKNITNQNANAGSNNEPLEANNQIKKSNTNCKAVTFDDFLKDGKNQAEFDRRVQQAITTAQQKWKTKDDIGKSDYTQLHIPISKLARILDYPIVNINNIQFYITIGSDANYSLGNPESKNVELSRSKKYVKREVCK